MQYATGLLAASANATRHAHVAADAELAQVRVVGLIATALFAGLAIVVPVALVARKNRHLASGAGRPGAHINIILPQALTRAVLALALLAAGWFFAPFNALLWDGGSVARVAFNALVWYSALLEVADFYGVQEPVRSHTFAHYAFVLLAFLALCTLGGGVARLTGLVAAAPLAALVALAACVWGAHRERLVLPAPRAGADVRYGHGVFAWLAALGLFALVTEACSAEYGGAMPLLGGYVCMLLAHIGLCALWAAMALAPAPEPRAADATPVDPLADGSTAHGGSLLNASHGEPAAPAGGARGNVFGDDD